MRYPEDDDTSGHTHTEELNVQKKRVSSSSSCVPSNGLSITTKEIESSQVRKNKIKQKLLLVVVVRTHTDLRRTYVRSNGLREREERDVGRSDRFFFSVSLLDSLHSLLVTPLEVSRRM